MKCATCQNWSKFKDLPLGVCRISGGATAHGKVVEDLDGHVVTHQFSFVTTDLQACSAWKERT